MTREDRIIQSFRGEVNYLFTHRHIAYSNKYVLVAIVELQSQQWKYLSTCQPLCGKLIRTEVQDGVGIITFDNPNSPVSHLQLRRGYSASEFFFLTE